MIDNKRLILERLPEDNGFAINPDGDREHRITLFKVEILKESGVVILELGGQQRGHVLPRTILVLQEIRRRDGGL